MSVVSDIEIRLRADIARLQQDMTQARNAVGGAMTNIRNAVGGAAKALAALGTGLAVGAFAGWIKGAIDAVDAIGDISPATGVAIKDIAGLQLAFQFGGVEAKVMETTMIKLSTAISKNDESITSLGIATKATGGDLRESKDVLYDLADAFAAMQDGTAKTAMATEVFGKTGAALIPMLNNGSEGLREMAEMAEKLGLTFTEEGVEAAGKFNDTLDFLGLAAQGVARQVGIKLLPTLNAVSGSFLELITKGDGVRKMADVIGTGFKIIYTGALAVGQAFDTVSSIIAISIGSVIDGFGTAAKTLKLFIEGEYAAAWEAARSGAQKTVGAVKNLGGDMAASWTASAKAISDAWTGDGAKVVAGMTMVQQAGAAVSDSASKDAAKAADAQQKLLVGMAGLSGDFYEKWDLLSGAYARNAISVEDLVSAQAALLEQQPFMKEAAEARKKANDDLAAAHDDYSKGLEATSGVYADIIKNAREEAAANEELAATFGKTKEQIERLAIARAEEQLAQRYSLGLTLDEIEYLEKLIEAKSRSAAAIANVQDLEQQRDMWTSIEKTAHDTFVSIADGGKDAVSRLKQTFKNGFFDWLYQQTLKKWIINIQANATTSSTGGLFGSSSGGGTDWLSVGQKLYDGFANGFSSVGTTLGGYIKTMGDMFGSSAVSAFGKGMTLNGAQAAEAASAYNGAGMQGTGNAISSGSTAGGVAGTAAAWLAAAQIGRALGNKISNGYSVTGKGSSNGFINFSTLTNSVPILGGIVGGLVNRAFGRKAREYSDARLTGTLGTSGVTGGAVTSSWSEKGGWFRSTKRGTEVQAVGQEMSAALADSFNAIRDATLGFADTFGVSADVITSYSKNLNVTLAKDAAANEQIFATLFGQIGDELAARIVPNIAAFALEGEATVTTLQRLAVNFKTVDAMLTTLGVSSQQAFNAVGVASIAARERLITLAGGIDALGSQLTFFADNFLTQAQQIAPLQHMVAQTMSELGYAGVTTAAQFRDAVLGLAQSGALATEAGSKTYAGLLALAPAFKALTDATDQAQRDLLDQLRGRADGAMGVLQRAVDAQKNAVTSAYESSMAALETQLDGVNAAIGRTAELSRALAGALRGVESPDQQAGARMAAQAQVQAAVAIAKASGVLPSADDLRDALGTLGRDAADQFRTLADYQREAARTNNALLELGGLSDRQLSVSEQQAKTLAEQREFMTAANTAELSRLDGMVAAAQQQLDTLNGINTSVRTVAQAVGYAEAAIIALRYQAYASPNVAPAQVSGTMGDSSPEMLEELRAMNARLAAIEASNAATARSSDQFAREFSNVSAGGNALLTEAI